MRMKQVLSLLGTILILGGLVIVFISINYMNNEPWNSILTHLGSVMIGAGVVELLINIFAMEQLIERATGRILNAIKFPIAAFYADREYIEPVTEELKGINEIWVAWHAGTVAYTKAFFPEGRNGRIIPTDPSSKHMEMLGKVGGKSAAEQASDIKALTKKTLETKGIDVRWFDGPVCNSLIIADPKSNKAWIRVELLVPYQSVGKRPSFRVEKSKNNELFNTFYDSYGTIWESSHPPQI
jgi:hypothetical protein